MNNTLFQNTAPETATPKTAIVLMNLGGPLKTDDIRPFLFNFFMDKNIIAAPLPVRYMLAHWISWRRARGAAREAYGKLGGRSPLLANTQAQARALETALVDAGTPAKVFVSMRYWHPLAEQTVDEIKQYDPDVVLLLPLYPQYSTTTTFSSFENWKRTARKAGLIKPTFNIGCYPLDDGFVAASAENIRAVYAKASGAPRLLFSAHGLPEKIIAGGDPYQYQCERSAAAIVEKLNIPGLDWQICYQSRVGPLKWIGPSTEEALEQAARDGVGVIVYPHAFVSEHVETIVEIDQEYRARAAALGIPYFAKVDTVGTHPHFIAGLTRLVRNALDKTRAPIVCTDVHRRCGCKEA